MRSRCLWRYVTVGNVDLRRYMFVRRRSMEVRDVCEVEVYESTRPVRGMEVEGDP